MYNDKFCGNCKTFIWLNAYKKFQSNNSQKFPQSLAKCLSMLILHFFLSKIKNCIIIKLQKTKSFQKYTFNLQLVTFLKFF